MATTKLTKRAVAATQPGARDTFLWDADLAGFGLKATPAGGKVCLVQYRAGGRGTPTRRVIVGRHGSPWTSEAARREERQNLRPPQLPPEADRSVGACLANKVQSA